jgi:hypothetical protein
MNLLRPRETIRRWSKEMFPVFLVLSFSLFLTFYSNDPSSSGTGKILYRFSLRFFRYTVFLCLPLYLLKPIYAFIIEKRRETLVQVEQRRELTIYRLKHWLFRPFQGIGIGFLFATKLLTVFQVIAGPPATSPLPAIPGQFQLGRFFLVTGITMFISILLSTLWTLDDLGIRYHNRRDQELKMIGKYVGTLMPTIFGLYGLFSLLTHYPKGSAFTHGLRIIMALYPPMVVFAVVHTHFIKGRADFHSRKNLLRKGGIWQEEGIRFPS